MAPDPKTKEACLQCCKDCLAACRKLSDVMIKKNMAQCDTSKKCLDACLRCCCVLECCIGLAQVQDERGAWTTLAQDEWVKCLQLCCACCETCNKRCTPMYEGVTKNPLPPGMENAPSMIKACCDCCEKCAKECKKCADSCSGGGGGCCVVA